MFKACSEIVTAELLPGQVMEHVTKDSGEKVILVSYLSLLKNFFVNNKPRFEPWVCW